MTRGQDGSLDLSCVTLAFTTPRRFIPAHQKNADSPSIRSLDTLASGRKELRGNGSRGQWHPERLFPSSIGSDEPSGLCAVEPRRPSARSSSRFPSASKGSSATVPIEGGVRDPSAR